MNTKEQYNENRQKLIAMSKAARMMVKEGVYDFINEAIVEAFYKSENPQIEEFKTFHQWKEEGKTIKKGEKAFLIWGQPRQAQKRKEANEGGEDEEFKYWPICYLFSNLQVFDRKAATHEA